MHLPELITVATAPGHKVRDPRTGRPIPDTGVRVDPREPFWHRRLAAGDVIAQDAELTPERGAASSTSVEEAASTTGEPDGAASAVSTSADDAGSNGSDGASRKRGR